MFVLSLALQLATSPADSVALVRHARRAQVDFEWIRRTRLPFVSGASRGDHCDARVGRFCYWYDPSPLELPPEPSSIGQARNRLIHVLDSAARAVPGDEWLAGQRVRYLLEADSGGGELALAAARACRAAAWWCEALEGLARHAASDYSGADSVFDLALRDMPADERCRWTDLSVLLADSLRRSYRPLGCDERDSLNARIWFLARPLLAQRGNDRRTEHFARATMARVWRQGASPYGGLAGADEAELIVRYGWPVAWAQREPLVGLGVERAVIGSERDPSYHFLPASLAGPGPARMADDPRARERYAPAYAATIVTLDPQFSTFRRGDSTLVVATYDVRHDTLFRETLLEAAFVLAWDEATESVVSWEAHAAASGVLVAAAPWAPGLVSLEVTAPATRRVARGRAIPRSLQPPGQRVVVSDLLAFDPPDSLPADLPDVLPHVRLGNDLPRGSRLGLYWEVYGLAAIEEGEPLATSVSVVPERTGWLRRAAQSLGLAGPPRLVRLEWTEAGVSREGIWRRALLLDVSALAPGRYRIDVTVRAAGAPPAVAARAVRIVAP